MEYRIDNIIQTLKTLPPPEYNGQVYTFFIRKASWEEDPLKYTDQYTAEHKELGLYNVKAVRRHGGSSNPREWLEWTMDL